MNLLRLLILTSVVAHPVYAKTIYGEFYFTSNGFANGSIIYPPEPVEEPANFIFDVDSQKLLIFNFVEDDIQFEYPDIHTYEVTRRNGSAPITTIEELIDFTVSKWRLDEEYIDEFGMQIVGQCEVRTDGSWLFSTFALFGPHTGSGEITSIYGIKEIDTIPVGFLSKTGDLVRLSFTAQENKDYSVEWSSDLSPNSWEKRIEGISLEINQANVTFSEGAPDRAFFRISETTYY